MLSLEKLNFIVQKLFYYYYELNVSNKFKYEYE